MSNKEKPVTMVKTIKLKQETFNRLQNHGKMCQTPDEVITDLINYKESQVN
jgi:hypothetical protein